MPHFRTILLTKANRNVLSTALENISIVAHYLSTTIYVHFTVKKGYDMLISFLNNQKYRHS